MYAILSDRGRQYKVQPGDLLQVDKLSAKVGDKVKFGDVLLTGDGGTVKVGSPLLSGASVAVEVVEHIKGEKTIAHHRVRTNSLGRRRGHRTQYTVVKVTGIE